MRAYNKDLRNKSISHDNTCKYQIKDLAKMFDMTRQTIASWIKRYKETGDYSFKQYFGKAREIRFNDRTKLLEYSETNANADGVDVYMYNDTSVSGFQFAVNGLSLSGASGGSAEADILVVALFK